MPRWIRASLVAVVVVVLLVVGLGVMTYMGFFAPRNTFSDNSCFAGPVGACTPHE